MEPAEMLCYLIGNSSKRGEIVLDRHGTLPANVFTSRVCW